MKRLTEKRESPLVMSMWAKDSQSLRIYNRLLGVSTDFTTFTLQESEWHLTRAEAEAALKAREQDEKGGDSE